MNLIRCKIALVGDPRVGKTNIVSQLVKNSFNNTYQTTLGIDYTQSRTSTSSSTSTTAPASSRLPTSSYGRWRFRSC